MDEREQQLGFKPQKEIVYNKLLPYADKLDEESNYQLAEIKTNIGKAVLLREMRPGIVHWTARLYKYIRLYGRKFSKEDHISFINLYYNLITIEDLEVTLVQDFANLLIVLLKKRELLSRDDLELQWKPLQELYESIAYSQFEAHGLVLFPGRRKTLISKFLSRRAIENTLKNLIRCCRVYFCENSTQEMLEEWRPLLCPFDLMMCKGISYLELFLPTLLPPELHHKGFKLWFEELMGIWGSCHNVPTWETNLVWLFARLAQDNIGYIDWEPHIPLIFTRLLRSFNLPVGSKNIQVGRSNCSFELIPTVVWISSMLGGGNSCQDHVGKLFKALESYYHPSNTGRWMIKLQRLLYKLPAALIKRLHRERYKKNSWETPIPESQKLTENDITQFVESIKHPVLLAMFSKTGSADSSAALQNLSVIRPEIVIPPLLERIYPALETLTEPHRLTATMACMVSVARSLLRGGKYFPEGPSHMIPLLMLSIPGVDPNDIKKCMVTFQFISTYTTIVPLVDCSKALECRDDLTEREQELCLATTGFEDFVLQFMDKCFALIENSALQHTTRLDRDTEKLNTEEGMLEIGLSSTFNAILTQCSPEIFETALRRLLSFVTSHVLEIRVAGKFAADMCRVASKVSPELALKAFIPKFCNRILNLTEGDDVANEEQLDDELLWNLQLLSEVLRSCGEYLLPFKDMLIKVLKATLHLVCKQGYLLASAMLRFLFKSLLLIYPREYKSVPDGFGKTLEEYLPLRDWGKPGNINNLQIKWHVPSKEERDFAQQLMQIFLLPELEKLEKFVEGKLTLSKDELQQRLTIITECLAGAAVELPMWKGDALHLMDSSVSLETFATVVTVNSEGLSIRGQNIRAMTANVMRILLAHINASREDDTKSLFLIIKIYRMLLFFRGAQKEDFSGRWKSFHVVKKAMENKLVGSKQHIRALLVDRAQLQHEGRVLDKGRRMFTQLHKDLMYDLLQLSTSHYSEVRSKAQVVLAQGFETFPFCHHIMLPDILAFLKNQEDISHEQFKGSLYILLGQKNKTLLIDQWWKNLKKIWPAVIEAQHSEKPSIIRLVDQITDKIQKNLETLSLDVLVSDSCLCAAKHLWSKALPQPSQPLPQEDQIAQGLSRLTESNKENLRIYKDLIHNIVELLESGNLRWRHHHLAISLLALLIRYDTQFPTEGVEVFCNSLINDQLNIRKIAINTLAAILKIQKRKHKTYEVDPYSICNLPRPSNMCPGLRPDNQWICYNNSSLPTTKELWEKCIFVNKTHWGYYIWPKLLTVYSPSTEQPPLGRTREELLEGEIILYDFFMNKAHVDKLISFLSLEDRKGKDKFDARRFNFFKGLFRNYDDAFLMNLRDHLERLVSDSQESSQRCASEIIAGIIRGSKHWTFSKVKAMWEMLTPILKIALSKITVETVADWGTCIATATENQDPRKLHWLYNLLMENPLKGEEGAFIEASRLYVLQGCLAQQEWKVFELLHRVLDYLKPFLTHSFQNVRDRLGSLLTNIFLYDVNIPKDSTAAYPQRVLFIQEILPLLTVLTQNGNKLLEDSPQRNHIDMHSNESEERKSAIKLVKTVLKWLMGNLARSLYSAPPELFQMLPIICQLENEVNDVELRKDAALALACMAQALILPDNIPVAQESIKQVVCSNSWHVRAGALAFLQVMVFNNFFTVMSDAKRVEDMRSMILKLLSDEQVEVREMTAVTLSGFLHCDFVTLNNELLKTFNSWASTKLKKKRNSTEPISSIALIQRHAGVLGLSACIAAFPYEVPDFMPDILMSLSDHLNDPQPIQMTVKKTLSNFRRTHHDNWQDHKLKFTDDQLAILTDLLVSPSYYA